MMADAIGEVCDDLDFEFVYKTSFDKANRTRLDSYRGVHISRLMDVFSSMRARGIWTTTDIHVPEQAVQATHASIIQIPALLSRQTDLIVAAGKTGKTVNIKLGQGMNPKDIIHAVEKVGHDDVIVTNRGSSFGYNNVVLDFRAILDWHRLGLSVCYDVTHPCQYPSVGGDWEYTKVFAPAAAAAGVDYLFMEVHDDPANAKSDGANSVPLDELRTVLKSVWRVCK